MARRQLDRQKTSLPTKGKRGRERGKHETDRLDINKIYPQLSGDRYDVIRAIEQRNMPNLQPSTDTWKETPVFVSVLLLAGL